MMHWFMESMKNKSGINLLNQTTPGMVRCGRVISHLIQPVWYATLVCGILKTEVNQAQQGQSRNGKKQNKKTSQIWINKENQVRKKKNKMLLSVIK